MPIHRTILAALLAAASSLGLAAYQNQAPKPFRSTTALVQVDAIILDKDGNFVPGIKLEDLQLFEDGRPQKIEQFYMVTHELGARSDLLGKEQLTEAEFAEHRLFVILFDEGHLSHESLARAKVGATEFIQSQMGDGDVGGVFVNGGMFRGRLTTSKTELVAGVHSVQPGFDNRQALLAPFREFPQIPGETDAMRIADGALEVVVRLGNKARTDDPFDCQREGGLQQIENLIQQKARLYISQARVMTGQTLENLRTVTAGLTKFPGRKTVVFMTEGFFVEESRSALQLIAAQAARAGTTIYTIDGRGLTNGSGVNPDALRASRARSTVFDTGEDGPAILTSGTGGFVVRNVEDMSRAFGLIVRDTSTYYVIGYAPENAKMDGKYRKIEVRARHGRLNIRARKGYVAYELPPPSYDWKWR